MDLKTLGVIKARQPAYVAPDHDLTAPANHRLKLHKAPIRRHGASQPFPLNTSTLPVAHRVAT